MDETLQLILGVVKHVKRKSGSSPIAHDLVAVGLTSKTFLEPSLDQIWRVVSSQDKLFWVWIASGVLKFNDLDLSLTSDRL